MMSPSPVMAIKNPELLVNLNKECFDPTAAMKTVQYHSKVGLCNDAMNVLLAVDDAVMFPENLRLVDITLTKAYILLHHLADLQ